MLNIAIAGRFDPIVGATVRRLQNAASGAYRIVGLHPVPLRIPHVVWRTGSLMTARNTTTMLGDVDVLVYFCLTSPGPQSTPEGIMRDVSLCAATCLAETAAARPGLRVVLVTRATGGGHHAPDSAGAFWRHVESIFRACPNLRVVRTGPLLSDRDPVTRAAVEHCMHARVADIPGAASRAAVAVRPDDFLRAVCDAVESPTPGDFSPDAAAIPWDEWFRIQFAAIPSGRILRGLRSVRMHIHPDVHHRAEILREYIDASPAVTDVPRTADHARIRAIRLFCSDALDDIDSTLANDIPEDRRLREKHDETCYVQRVLDCPTRPVGDIAALLMAWLPQFFHTVSVDEAGGGRVLCRTFRIPIVELERRDESPNRCRIVVRSPWSSSFESPTSFVVTTTGTPDEPGILLVVVENTPNLKIMTAMIRALLLSFGRYLREYGCGR